jgi:hypothetical protein
MPGEYLVFAKFVGICPLCGGSIAKDDVILYSPSLKRARHRHCPKYDGREQVKVFNTWNEKLKEERVNE